jgi:serine/threonine-protein kinase RsbW
VVRLFVSSLAAARRTLSEERIHDLKLAVSEACTNAVEACRSDSSDKGVVVRWEEGDDFLQVTVEDRGPGFDPDKLPDRPVIDSDRLSRERGLGIPLIRTLVDDVSFTPSSDGTLVKMVMHCESATHTERSA